MLNKKLEISWIPDTISPPDNQFPKRPPQRRSQEKSTFEKVLTSPTTKQIGRTFAREITRGILGILGLKR